VAGRLYARVGVVNSILLLPVVYLAGFALWLVRFDLATAAVVRFAQLTILGGLAGTAYNALFNVVPSEKRGQVRAYQAGVPAQLGVMLSGGLLWMGQRGLDERSVFLAGIAVAIACGYVVLRTRQAYGQSLVDSLRAGVIDIFGGSSRDLRGLGADGQARAVAVAALQDPRPAGRRIAVEVLARMGAADFVNPLMVVTRDPDAGVRLAAVRALGPVGGPEVGPALRERLADSDLEVRVAALDALARAHLASDDVLRGLLADSEPAVRAEAAVAILDRGDDREASAVVQRLMASADAAEQIAGIQAAGRAVRLEAANYLTEALRSNWRPLRLAALTALAARADAQASRHLVMAMDDPDPVLRRAAAEAYGSSALDAQPLMEALTTGGPRLQEAALHALPGKIDGQREAILDWAIAQVPRAREQRRVASGLQADGAAPRSTAAMYLSRLVEEEERQLEQRILAALTLLWGEEAMPVVARGVRSRDPSIRSQAVEALDTLGDKRVTRALVPLLEAAEEPSGVADFQALLARLSEHPRTWVRALAMRAMAERTPADQRRPEDTRLREADPQVKALLAPLPSAQAARREGVLLMETSATLSTMERVLFLRQVPLFARLEPEDLQQIAELSVERVYEPGDPLVQEGDLGDELFVIVDGGVRVTKRSNGVERVLRHLSTGDHLGELAILREQPRSATATAEAKPVRVLALRGVALTAILEDRPAVSLAMLSSLAERLGTLA
jgi:CRP-like cAMP-binding protein